MFYRSTIPEISGPEEVPILHSAFLDSGAKHCLTGGTVNENAFKLS
jgi:hypothetical protein